MLLLSALFHYYFFLLEISNSLAAFSQFDSSRRQFLSTEEGLNSVIIIFLLLFCVTASGKHSPRLVVIRPKELENNFPRCRLRKLRTIPISTHDADEITNVI